MAIIAIVIIAVATIDDFRSVRTIQDDGIAAMAVVESVHDRRRLPDEPRVVFVTAEGDTIHTTVGWHRWSGSPAAGERRQILYLPSDPEGSVLDSGLPFAHFTHLLGLLLVGVLAGVCTELWRKGMLLSHLHARRSRRG
ncbi:DUF3592 domain-containing protein [Nonomuraea sp. NPDC050663]|uniref:DUF3592 domain-containing protein n=1 Tax=Nonomuraea sp. NPDC050663 TaxID=3364370 RepID=UPI0037A2A140